MDKKEAFNKLITTKGYKSLYDFCLTNNIDKSNMSKRLANSDTRQKIEIGFMFKIANILHVPVEKIIEIFYEDDWKENRSLIEK